MPPKKNGKAATAATATAAVAAAETPATAPSTSPRGSRKRTAPAASVVESDKTPTSSSNAKRPKIEASATTAASSASTSASASMTATATATAMPAVTALPALSQIAIASPSTQQPEAFFDNFVKTRTPVLLTGTLGATDNWLATPELWTLDYLKKKAGEEVLKIEHRDSTAERYGQGKEVKMKFSEFLDKVAAGDELHYLTTQEIGVDVEDRPNLYSAPVVQLRSDFPLRPSLLGSLVPFNINLWMGNTVNGSNSGLHHDFHDNLYILIKGTKRFRVYSPADAPHMYTRGTVEKIHNNGRINYVGAPTRSDGCDLGTKTAMTAEHEAELAQMEVEEAEAAVKNKVPGAKKRLAAAEERLETALQAILEAEEENGGNDDAEEDEGEDDDNVDLFGAPVAKKEQTQPRSAKVEGPLNFSQVNPTLPSSELAQKFPLFTKANPMFFDVKAGEMLYLPAGWFHEVISFGNGKEPHIAFNYWFHPPDGNSFEKSYTDPFWENDWKQRKLK